MPNEIETTQKNDGLLTRKIAIGGKKARVEKTESGHEVKIFDAVVSSNTPLEMFSYRFGMEITQTLRHDDDAITYNLIDGSIPLLDGHRSYEQALGKLQNFRVENGELRAEIVMMADLNTKSGEVAAMMESGLTKSLSVGFEIMKSEFDEEKAAQEVTEWRLYEVSVVSIPADKTAGVRKKDLTPDANRQLNDEIEIERGDEMPKPVIDTETKLSDAEIDSAVNAKVDAILTERKTQIGEAEKRISQMLANRPESVSALADDFKAEARHAIENGEPVNYDKMHDTMLERAAADNKTDVREISTTPEADAERQEASFLELRAFEQQAQKAAPDFDVSSRSLGRALYNFRSGRASRETDAWKELNTALASDMPAEMNDYLARNGGFILPHGVQAYEYAVDHKRAQTIGGASGVAAALVDTVIAVDEYRESLYGKTPLSGLGVRMLTGLSSNIAFPKQLTKRNVAFVGEVDAIAPTDITMTSSNITPHRIGAATDIGFQLLIQSSIGLQALFMDDIHKAIQEKCEEAFLTGDGSGNNPLGVLNVDGVNAITHGTNGGNITWKLMQSFNTAIRNGNINGMIKYLTTPNVADFGLTTPRAAGNDTPIFSEGRSMGDTMAAEASYAGKGIWQSTLMPQSGTKGTGTNLNAMIAGDFSETLIAIFGSGDIITYDDITMARTGKIGLTVQRFLDHHVFRAAALSVAEDISVA